MIVVFLKSGDVMLQEDQTVKEMADFLVNHVFVLRPFYIRTVEGKRWRVGFDPAGATQLEEVGK
jgi:hypothetical protein